MRSRSLHAAVLAFVEEAAGHLDDVADGEEIPFEVVRTGSLGGRRTPLYCYRTLTAEFINAHLGELARLPAYGPAVRALGAVPGLEGYLRVRGETHVPSNSHARADVALRLLLASTFSESTDFAVREERVAHAYDELEAALFRDRGHTLVITGVHGLAIASDDVALDDGLGFARREVLAELPEAEQERDGDRAPGVYAVLALETAPDAALTAAAAGARARLTQLLTALRLFGADVAFDRVAWARIDGGAWQPMPLGRSGRARGARVVTPEQEDELRAFCNLVARRTPTEGELAWALTRFELGCDRTEPAETLTDHLLALRALLEPEGPASARLAGRLAVLCATPENHGALVARVGEAIGLERAVIEGRAQSDAGLERLVCELAAHLRALLRDVMCGHLAPDLAGVADDLIDHEAAELEAAAELEQASALDADPDAADDGLDADGATINDHSDSSDPALGEELAAAAPVPARATPAAGPAPAAHGAPLDDDDSMYW